MLRLTESAFYVHATSLSFPSSTFFCVGGYPRHVPPMSGPFGAYACPNSMVTTHSPSSEAATLTTSRFQLSKALGSGRGLTTPALPPATPPPRTVHIATVESFLHFKGISTQAAENPAVHALLTRVLRSAGKSGTL